MDIWEKMYQKAKEQYHPQEVSPFVYAHHVVAAVESENGEIYTGFCIESACNTVNLCAERVAALNMYVNSGQTVIKRVLAFRERPPETPADGMPCGVCREFLLQLNEKNRDTEIMVNYPQRQTVRLEDTLPNWWGWQRHKEAKNTET